MITIKLADVPMPLPEERDWPAWLRERAVYREHLKLTPASVFATRETATKVRLHVLTALAAGKAPAFPLVLGGFLELDCAGVDVVSPPFLDELLKDADGAIMKNANEDVQTCFDLVAERKGWARG